MGLVSFVPLVALTVWFRRESAKAYRATREAVALVIVQFVETLNGIRAVLAFRREPRNQAIFGDLNERYRRATQRSFTLIAVYAPGMKLVANITIGVVLLYGGQLALDGRLRVGVLTAFLPDCQQRFEVAANNVLLQGALLELDASTGRAVSIRRVSEAVLST